MRGRPERRGDGVVEWVRRGVEREQRCGGDERVPGVQLGDVEIRQRWGREPWIRRLDRWARRRGLGGRRERDERGGRSGLRVGGSQHGDDGWGVCDGERRRKREEQREREGGERERGNRRVERATGLQLGCIADDGQLGCGAAGLWSGDCRSRRKREGECREWDEWSRRVDGAALWSEHGDERRVGAREERRGHGDEQRGDEHLDRERRDIGGQRCSRLHVGVGENGE
jgi:hypothetical protein